LANGRRVYDIDGSIAEVISFAMSASRNTSVTSSAVDAEPSRSASGDSFG
jgi:hypothetical protein